jgi:hypothetical protein
MSGPDFEHKVITMEIKRRESIKKLGIVLDF